MGKSCLGFKFSENPVFGSKLLKWSKESKSITFFDTWQISSHFLAISWNPDFDVGEKSAKSIRTYLVRKWSKNAQIGHLSSDPWSVESVPSLPSPSNQSNWNWNRKKNLSDWVEIFSKWLLWCVLAYACVCVLRNYPRDYTTFFSEHRSGPSLR